MNPTVQAKSNFWLVLHSLANELEKEGDDDKQRVENLFPVLESAPRDIVAAYLENLETVAGTITAILARAKTR